MELVLIIPIISADVRWRVSGSRICVSASQLGTFFGLSSLTSEIACKCLVFQGLAQHLRGLHQLPTHVFSWPRAHRVKRHGSEPDKSRKVGESRWWNGAGVKVLKSDQCLQEPFDFLVTGVCAKRSVLWNILGHLTSCLTFGKLPLLQNDELAKHLWALIYLHWHRYETFNYQPSMA